MRKNIKTSKYLCIEGKRVYSALKISEEIRSLNVINGETGYPIAPKGTSCKYMHDNSDVQFELKNKNKKIKVI